MCCAVLRCRPADLAPHAKLHPAPYQIFSLKTGRPLGCGRVTKAQLWQSLCPKQDGKVKFLLGSTAATYGLFAVRLFSNTLKPVEFIAYIGAMW